MNSRLRLDRPTGTPDGNTKPENWRRSGRAITVLGALMLLIMA